MQEFWLEVISGAVLGMISFFIFAFSMHMLKSGKAIRSRGSILHYIWGSVLMLISVGVLIGAPIALFINSPIAFVACAVVGWLFWFRNLKF